MTLEELLTALDLNTDEAKDKAAIVKKEYNAQQKALKKLTDSNEELTKTVEENKAVIEKFNTVVSAFNLDANAKDFDENIQTAKDELIKEAGGGTTPEEIKELKLKLTKAERENKKFTEQVTELTTQLESEKTQRINNVKRDAVHKAAVKNNIIDPETTIDMFMNLVTVDEDGKTVTMTMSDGTVLPINDGMADWAKEHPKFVEKQVTGGAGSGSGKGANGGNNNISSFMQDKIKSASDGGNGNSNQSLASLFG